MKLYYPISIFLILLSISLQAQQTEFTLEQCIDYALQNSVSLKNAQLDEKIADSKVKETRGIGLPQVNGNVSLRHNEKLARFFATKATSFGFSGLPEDQYATYLPELSDNDVVAIPNFFQLKSSGDAGITIDQLIFNSSYLVGLRAANAYRELSVKQTDQTREQVVQQVTKAYYSCLINKDRIALFDNNIARVDSLLRNTNAMYQNGFAESIDVDRTQVTLNNLTIERNKFMNLQEISLQLLKFQMNYPMDQPLEVAGDIASITVDEALLSEYAVEWDYTNRTDYKLLESNRALQTLDIKNKFSASVPTLSAFANFGYSTQSPNIGGLFKTESNISDDGRIGPDKWYPYTSFGLTLNIPIFSGLQRNYQIKQAKLTLEKIENEFTTMKASIDLEIKQAAANYLNAVESAKAQEQNRVLAEKVARITKIKYEEGVGSSMEVVQAESDLREAQINYYNALYDAVVAQIDLKKAYGKLIAHEE